MNDSLALVTVRGEDFHPNQRLLQAASEQGVRACLLNPYRMVPCLEPEGLGLAQSEIPKVVLPRQGSDLGAYCLDILRQMELAGARVVNRPAAVALCSRKQAALQVLAAGGVPLPRTCLAADEKGLWQALDELGGFPLVVKKPAGRQGNGVALIRNRDEAAGVLDHWLKRRQGLILQEYVAPKGRHDYRLLMVGSDCVGAMELKPKQGDFRANYHQGHGAVAFAPGPKLVELAAGACRALGLEIAGVDIMVAQDGRAFLCEANYAPGFAGLEKATGLDVAGAMIAYIIKKWPD